MAAVPCSFSPFSPSMQCLFSTQALFVLLDIWSFPVSQSCQSWVHFWLDFLFLFYFCPFSHVTVQRDTYTKVFIYLATHLHECCCSCSLIRSPFFSICFVFCHVSLNEYQPILAPCRKRKNEMRKRNIQNNVAATNKTRVCVCNERDQQGVRIYTWREKKKKNGGRGRRKKAN